MSDFPTDWEPGICPFCKRSQPVGRPWVGALGATPDREPCRFAIDVTPRCEDCLKEMGLDRRNYLIPSIELDVGIVTAMERYLPIAKRKVDERWNYLADQGSLDPNNFRPMKRRTISE
jgi:hypothetical protein